MEQHDAYYRQYVQILREELRPATGCTEPIAIAYAAAKARSVLNCCCDILMSSTLITGLFLAAPVKYPETPNKDIKLRAVKIKTSFDIQFF